MRLLLLPLFFLFFAEKPAPNALNNENPWVFKHEKSGIRVFYRDPGTGVYELRLTTKVPGTLHSIAALLTDVEAYPKWVYKTSEAWRVRTTSANEMYYYVVSDFPWPMDDRDVVVVSRIHQDKNSKALISSSSAVPGQIDLRKNCVRMPITDTKWICKKTADGHVEIEYTLKSDPGGALPDWLVNMALDFGPVETMKSFKKMVAEPKYRDATVDYVED